MRRAKYIMVAMATFAFTSYSYAQVVYASQSNSTNYGVDEVNFGSGGELHACSSNYCSKQSIGELTAGNTKSSNYQAQAGFNTNREPLLEVTVAGGIVDLGELDPTTTRYGSTTFSVRSYLASGYNVLIDGTSPKNKTTGSLLATMPASDSSRPGVEQFGINLKQNTTPSVGADAVQVPSGSFSFGMASAGYDTANMFKYVAGDRIAQSAGSSGETDYTLSMIANISTTTPSGAYGGRLTLNVIPSF